MSVEVDALPVDVLRTRIVAEVEKCVDLDALAGMRQLTAQAVGCYIIYWPLERILSGRQVRQSIMSDMRSIAHTNELSDISARRKDYEISCCA